jgi:hypothetical protein
VKLIRRQPLAVFLIGSVLLGSVATRMLARIPTNPVILPLVALPISYIPAALSSGSCASSLALLPLCCASRSGSAKGLGLLVWHRADWWPWAYRTADRTHDRGDTRPSSRT